MKLLSFTVQKIDEGSKLIIGQHGGAHGMGKWNLPEEHQIDISNNYLTWGWGTEKKGKRWVYIH